ncbi:MAG: hypothetical protein WC323_04470 [Patescibacteria group bacterium]|jgi:VIT1/CCC1 family predicted Fe2+/Mn2+ transporter
MPFKNSFIVSGLSFGLTSGVITTLGLLVGLEAGTGSAKIVLAGILTIAVADAFSDALGMHMSEESKSENSPKEVWQATVSTLLAKFLFALSFVVPVLFLSISTAVIASIIWGLFLILTLSYIMAKKQKENPLKPMAEHFLIAAFVIIITHYIGHWIGN